MWVYSVNDNGRRDFSDEYIKYRLVNDDDGDPKPSKGNSGGWGWGILMVILIIAIIWYLLNFQ